ncbi:hypothetical protein D3C81_1647090 [compost metagenome]
MDQATDSKAPTIWESLKAWWMKPFYDQQRAVKEYLQREVNRDPDDTLFEQMLEQAEKAREHERARLRRARIREVALRLSSDPGYRSSAKIAVQEATSIVDQVEEALPPEPPPLH